MRIDLHTHSDRSDGTDAPAELIRRAARLGLDMVALSDHDTVDGWLEAAAAAEVCGIDLVPGIEISCRYAGAGVHLLAYFLDPTYPPLVAELEAILAGRNARLPAILDQLHSLGIDVTAADVRREAGPAAALGRPHVADALVAAGVVGDRAEAFDRLLAPGRPAYVDRYAADLATVIGLVGAGGGVSVIAHPWSRQSKAALHSAALAELRDAGLAGVEVDHEDHDQPAREQLRHLSRDLGLICTGSSDYHGTGKVGHELGCHTTAPDEFAALVERARAAAVATGRAAPQLAPL